MFMRDLWLLTVYLCPGDKSLLVGMTNEFAQVILLQDVVFLILLQDVDLLIPVPDVDLRIKHFIYFSFVKSCQSIKLIKKKILF